MFSTVQRAKGSVRPIVVVALFSPLFILESAEEKEAGPLVSKSPPPVQGASPSHPVPSLLSLQGGGESRSPPVRPARASLYPCASVSHPRKGLALPASLGAVSGPRLQSWLSAKRRGAPALQEQACHPRPSRAGAGAGAPRIHVISRQRPPAPSTRRLPAALGAYFQFRGERSEARSAAGECPALRGAAGPCGGERGGEVRGANAAPSRGGGDAGGLWSGGCPDEWSHRRWLDW